MALSALSAPSNKRLVMCPFQAETTMPIRKSAQLLNVVGSKAERFLPAVALRNVI